MPLVECAFTVANASIASEVRRLLARMVEAEDASGGTVRLLARLRRPIGEGGSVVGLAAAVGGLLVLCVVGEEDRPAVYAAEETLTSLEVRCGRACEGDG